MVRRRLPSGLLVAALLLSACSAMGDQGTPSTAPSPASPSASATAEVLDFSAPRLGGGTVDGADYVGADLAIWFWAPW